MKPNILPTELCSSLLHSSFSPSPLPSPSTYTVTIPCQFYLLNISLICPFFHPLFHCLVIPYFSSGHQSNLQCYFHLGIGLYQLKIPKDFPLPRILIIMHFTLICTIHYLPLLPVRTSAPGETKLPTQALHSAGKPSPSLRGYKIPGQYLRLSSLR